MNTDIIKNQLQIKAIDLLDLIENLKRKGYEGEVIGILERISNLGSITVLNFSDLTEEEVNSVVKTIALSESILEKKDNREYLTTLKNLVSSVERLFIEKKLLLDKNPDKIKV